MAASPVKPVDFQSLIVSVGATLCTSLIRTLLQLPAKLYQAWNWMIDSAGNVTDDFRAQLWPPGSVILSAGASAPAGRWLECNWASYERADYPDLFAQIGTSFGSADSTHFNVPDLRGRSPIGAGNLLANDALTAGQTYTRGDRIGSEGVVLEMPNLPSEPPPLATKVDALLVHRSSGTSGTQIDIAGTTTTDYYTRTNSETDHADNALGDLGTDTPHENRGPSLVMRYWIAF